MFLFTPHQMRLLDDLSIHKYGISSLKLMERAGKAVVDVILYKFSPVKQKHFVIFCGLGNNGGDGMVVARLLVKKGARVSLVQNSVQFSAFLRQLCLKQASQKPVLIIDALFGTGVSRNLEGLPRKIIQWINKQKIPRLSVDIPSGLNGETGELFGCAVKADLTVTFGFPKLGFFLGKARDYVGELHVADIGLTRTFPKPSTHLITVEEIKPLLTPRPRLSHKGSLGHVFVIGGSEGKIGAGIMAAHSALLAGAGLSTLVCPANALKKIDPKALEIMYEPFEKWDLDQVLVLLKKATIVALGPGLGLDPPTVSFVRQFVKTYQGPLIIDADGLNALADDPSILKERKGVLTLLTPHPAEMGRLVKKSVQEIQSHRLNEASLFAKEYGVNLLLKGYRSILACPDGQIWINPTGNPAMANAGQGDVLTGIYAGLLAQFPEKLEALFFGCFLHGLVGDLLSGIVPGEKYEQPTKRVVLATDIARNLHLGYSFLKKKSEILRSVFY